MDICAERAAIRELIKTPSDTLICKYMPFEPASSLALPDRTVILPRFRDMNDPRETEANRFDCGSFTTDPPSDSGEVARRFGNALVMQARVFCAARDHFLDGQEETVRLRGFGKPRMWAQYGAKHVGACLVFDRTSLVRVLRKHLVGMSVWAGDVDYDASLLEAGAEAFHVDYDAIKKSLQDYLASHAEKWHRSLLFRKHEDWRDEQEWRIATLDSSTDDLIIKYGDALKYVVLGNSVTSDQTSAVRMQTAAPVLRLRYEPRKEDFILNVTASVTH